MKGRVFPVLLLIAAAVLAAGLIYGCFTGSGTYPAKTQGSPGGHHFHEDDDTATDDDASDDDSAPAADDDDVVGDDDSQPPAWTCDQTIYRLYDACQLELQNPTGQRLGRDEALTDCEKEVPADFWMCLRECAAAVNTCDDLRQCVNDNCPANYIIVGNP